MSRFVSPLLILIGICLAAWGRWLQFAPLPQSTTQTSSVSQRDANKVADSLAYKPIEQIRVGMRVPARNPEVSEAERAGFQDPDQATWREKSDTR